MSDGKIANSSPAPVDTAPKKVTVVVVGQFVVEVPVTNGMTTAALLRSVKFDPTEIQVGKVSIDGNIVMDFSEEIPSNAKGAIIGKNADNGNK